MLKKRLPFIVFFLVALLASLFAETLIERKLYFIFDGFGFFAWFGFLSCAVLIGVTKLVGLFMQRKDRYYEDD